MAVVDKRNIENLDNFRNQMMDEFLFRSEVSQLTNQMKRFVHELNMEEIDYLLGVQEWRRFVFQCSDRMPSDQSNRLLGNITCLNQKHGYSLDPIYTRMARNRMEMIPEMEDGVAVAKIAYNMAMEDNRDQAVLMAANRAFVQPRMRRLPRMGKRRPDFDDDFFLIPMRIHETPDTLVWRPFIPIDEKENSIEWSFTLHGVSSTYLVYVSFIGPQGIEEKTVEIISKKLLSMEPKWKSDKLLLCEDDVMKLPFSLVNNADYDVELVFRGYS